MGGLGNQMFQYAAARALAIRLNVNVKLDLTFLEDRKPKENFTFRNFELNCFNTNFEIASKEDISKFRRKSKLQIIFSSLTGKAIPYHFYEQNSNFSSLFNTLPSHTLLEGYWQTERYFLNIRPLLLKEFVWHSISDQIDTEVCRAVKNSNSVSIHVRRGDYVNNTHINSHHGTCNLNYYKQAIQHMNDLVDSPKFFMFSDDIEWVRKEFNFLESCVFVSNNNKENNNRDMMLMSLCKHNIIANSSFSWWGAWLNRNVSKVIIAPKLWFMEPSRNTSDLIPAQWIKI